MWNREIMMEGECIRIRSVDTPSDALVMLSFGLEFGVGVIFGIFAVVIVVVRVFVMAVLLGG